MDGDRAGAEIPGSPREGSGKGDVVAGLQVEDCETLEVDFYTRDDFGKVGQGSKFITSGRRCIPPGPGGPGGAL